MNDWVINIIDKIGFSCFNTIQVLELVDLGDTYDIITDDGDIFLEKDYCYVVMKPLGEFKYLEKIEYSTEHLEVYLERICGNEENTVIA